MTPFINWPLYVLSLRAIWCFWSLDINVSSDPVSHSPWNVWVFLFPQGIITQVNDQIYFRGGLVKSLLFILVEAHQCPSTQGPLQSVGSRSINWLSCGNWLRNRNFTGLQTLISWSFYPWFFCWYKLIGPLLAVLSILPLRTPCFINWLHNCVHHVHIIIIVTPWLLEVEYCCWASIWGHLVIPTAISEQSFEKPLLPSTMTCRESPLNFLVCLCPLRQSLHYSLGEYCVLWATLQNIIIINFWLHCSIAHFSTPTCQSLLIPSCPIGLP